MSAESWVDAFASEERLLEQGEVYSWSVNRRPNAMHPIGDSRVRIEVREEPHYHWRWVGYGELDSGEYVRPKGASTVWVRVVHEVMAEDTSKRRTNEAVGDILDNVNKVAENLTGIPAGGFPADALPPKRRMTRANLALAGIAIALAGSATGWWFLGAIAAAWCCAIGAVACIVGIGQEKRP